MTTLYETIGNIFDPMAAVRVMVELPREIVDVEYTEIDE